MNHKSAAGLNKWDGEINHSFVQNNPGLVKDLFDVIWYITIRPSQWGFCRIAPLLKPGKPKEEASSYRLIHLLIRLGQVLCGILDNRIRKIFKISIYQKVFQTGGSCIPCVFALYVFITTVLIKNQRSYFMFLDLTAAFEEVNRIILWYKMTKARIP